MDMNLKYRCEAKMGENLYEKLSPSCLSQLSSHHPPTNTDTYKGQGSEYVQCLGTPKSRVSLQASLREDEDAYTYTPPVPVRYYLHNYIH